MSFKKFTLEQWKTQSHESDSYGFENNTNLRIGDHPFKITEVFSEAPTLTRATTTIEPYYTNSFNLGVRISPGYVYDMNRYFPNIKIPLYVSKRRDGNFVFIQGSTKLNIGETQLADMRVPVEITNPYSLFIKTVGGFTDVTDGSGMLFLECVFRDITTIVGNFSSRIESVSILTDEQLKRKYRGAVINQFGATLPQRYRNKVRAFIFYTPENSRYRCLNSATDLFTKKLPPPDPSTYSEEFKKKLAIDRANAGGPYSHAFISQPSSLPTVKNDIFLRIS